MDTEITIIGAGVVGLAVAAELSNQYSGVYVIERHSKYGQETSSRNSEVIHSGIYYPKGSLKATLCVKGREMLYRYCTEKGIRHNQCGKMVVATSVDEAHELNMLFSHARENGVTDGRWLNVKEIGELEPNVYAASAILFPSTGIIDSYGLMTQLLIDASDNGVQFVFGAEVTNLRVIPGGYEVQIIDSGGVTRFTTSMIINSAGLNSDRVAGMVGISDNSYELFYWKGEYFSISGRDEINISRLVYPVPLQHNTGLGIHATIDLGGRIKLGPNAIYMPHKNIDYRVSTESAISVLNAAKRYLPDLKESDLSPDQSGIRPKLQRPGDPVRDFIIKNEADMGYKNFINLIGIESPGLTSCLSIARHVSSLILN